MNSMGGKLKWWQTGLIAAAASALGGLSAMQSKKKQRRLYEHQFKQAPWAPPSWVFAPVWTINNIFLIGALDRILNNDMPDKHKLLWLQGGIWFIFFTFNHVYFRKRSPLLAAIWTKADHILALASILVSFKRDKKIALHYVPLALWTSFASFVADYQAVRNPDPLFHSKALIH